MTALPTHSPEIPAMRAASKKMILRTLVTAGLLAFGIVAVRALESVMHATFDKPPAPLSKKLDLLGKNLGSPVRYEAVGPDEVMDAEMVQTLGTSDYLIRHFRDITKSEGAVGELLSLNVNYYATGEATPHVPELCWSANGREQVGTEVFEVKDVPHLYGPPTDLRVQLVSFKPQPVDLQISGGAVSPSGEPLNAYVGYVFHVNGQYVSNAREVTSRFWVATNRYAYHAKIEVTPSVRAMVSDPDTGLSQGVERPVLCTRAQAQQIIGDYLRVVIPEVEACLPDPAILTATVPATLPAPSLQHEEK